MIKKQKREALKKYFKKEFFNEKADEYNDLAIFSALFIEVRDNAINLFDIDKKDYQELDNIAMTISLSDNNSVKIELRKDELTQIKSLIAYARDDAKLQDKANIGYMESIKLLDKLNKLSKNIC